MPVGIHISPLEAEALRASGHESSLVGNCLTFNFADVESILKSLPEGAARQRLGGRFGAVATQLKIPDAMFKKPKAAPAKKPAHHKTSERHTHKEDTDNGA